MRDKLNAVVQAHNFSGCGSGRAIGRAIIGAGIWGWLIWKTMCQMPCIPNFALAP